MTLTFTFPVGCFVCGYRNVGVALWFGARVNKHSIRNDQSFIAVPYHCRECGWPMPHSIPNPRYRPDEESQRKITEARSKKGWAAA